MTTRFEIPTDNVAAKVIEGEALVINVVTGVYYSFNRTGAHIWQLAEAGNSRDAIIRDATERFGDDAAAPIGTFLDQVVAGGLLVETEADSEATTIVQVEGTEWSAEFNAPAISDFHDVVDMVALDPPLPGLAAQ